MSLTTTEKENRFLSKMAAPPDSCNPKKKKTT